MTTATRTPKLRYHTWRDIGGPAGLIIDLTFCGLVLVAAVFMMIFCAAFLLLNYLLSPVVAIVNWLQPRHWA